jgi:hypothetical protein
VPESVIKQLRELRRRFDVYHAEGLSALSSEDYVRLAEAIRKEGQIIDQQGRLLESFKLDANKQSRRKLRKPKEA